MRDLHPIEAAALGVAALALALRPLVVALVALTLTVAGYRPRFICHPAPVVARTEPLTVPRLRWLVRQQHGSSCRPGGRRIAQARKDDLLAALYGGAT